MQKCSTTGRLLKRAVSSQTILTSGGGSFANEDLTTTTFTMPANAAIITAAYKDAPAETTPVSGITVSGEGGSSTITAKGGTLQLAADITPANATNKAVTWTIVSGGNYAAVDADGIVTAKANGTVIVRATAQDGSAVSGDITITITGQSGGNDNSGDDGEGNTPNIYNVTKHFGEWKGSGTADARIDADHTKFVKLTYNGMEIDSKNYTITQGNTIITLKESYLNTYPNGTHTFVAHFSDGYSENITLTVNKTAGNTNANTDNQNPDTDKRNPGTDNRNPDTGDHSNMPLWIVVSISSLLGSICLLIGFRRRRLDSTK